MEVNQRIRELIEALNLRPPKFALKIGHKRPDKVYNVINDNTKVTTDILVDITKGFENVNGHWLLTGRGSMFFEQENIENKKNLEFKNPQTTQEFLNILNKYLDQHHLETQDLRKDKERLWLKEEHLTKEKVTLYSIIDFLKSQLEGKEPEQ
jgi:plasmid maintenance system antidote protein VapI